MIRLNDKELPASIKLSIALLPIFDSVVGTNHLELSLPENSNVKMLLQELIRTVKDPKKAYDLRVYLCRDDRICPREYVTVHINGRHIDADGGLETLLREGDEIRLTAISSGG